MNYSSLLMPLGLQLRLAEEGVYQLGQAHSLLQKAGGVPEKAFLLAGQLYLSSSGWLMLSVPNSLVRAAYKSIGEPGWELPINSQGLLNAHISVMDPDEVAGLGGPEKISERGHTYRYNLGPTKTVTPDSWNGIGKVVYISVDSPELRDLRRSYGLPPLRKGYEHHITVAVRKKRVLQTNEISKAATEKRYLGRYKCPHCGGTNAYNGIPGSGMTFRGGGHCQDCDKGFSIVGSGLKPIGDGPEIRPEDAPFRDKEAIVTLPTVEDIEELDDEDEETFAMPDTRNLAKLAALPLRIPTPQLRAPSLPPVPVPVPAPTLPAGPAPMLWQRMFGKQSADYTLHDTDSGSARMLKRLIARPGINGTADYPLAGGQARVTLAGKPGERGAAMRKLRQESAGDYAIERKAAGIGGSIRGGLSALRPLVLPATVAGGLYGTSRVGNQLIDRIPEAGRQAVQEGAAEVQAQLPTLRQQVQQQIDGVIGDTQQRIQNTPFNFLEGASPLSRLGIGAGVGGILGTLMQDRSRDDEHEGSRMLRGLGRGALMGLGAGAGSLLGGSAPTQLAGAGAGALLGSLIGSRF